MELSFGIWPNDPYQMASVGVATNSWGNKPIAWCVERAVGYGYKAVDFIDKMFFDLTEKELEQTLDDLIKLSQEKKVVFASMGSHHILLTPHSYITKGQISNVKRAIDIASRIGVRTVVSYIDGYYNPPTYILFTRNQAKDLFVDMVRECADYAGEKGLDFSIEPHQETLINLPDITLELIEKIGRKNVKVTIDFGGLYVGMKPHIPVKEAISQLGSYINHVHAKDITGTVGNWNMCWFGGGVVNFKECAEALKTINYQGYIGVEWEGWFRGGPEGVGDIAHNGLADFDRVAVEAKEFLEPFFKD